MNDKLNKEIKENDNELTAVESNKEEAVVEEVTAEVSEQKNEEKKSSTDNKKSIKDLGLKYISVEESTSDFFQQFIDYDLI